MRFVTLSLPPTAPSPSPVFNGRGGPAVSSPEVGATPPPSTEVFDSQLAAAEAPVPPVGAKQTMC